MNLREQGSALILAAFVLLLLTGMGLALVALSRTEVKMNQGDLRAKRAFYIAEAGLEVGRLSLFGTEDGSWTDDLQAVAGVNNTIDFDPALIEGAIVNNLGIVSGLQFSSPVDDVPLHAPDYLPSADPPGWYMAYLTNDPLETTQATTDGNDRIMLTGVGIGTDRSMEVVQAIVEPRHFLPPIPPAAITLLGETPPYFANGPSAVQSHTGNDCGVAGGPYVPIVGSVTDSGKSQIQTDASLLDAAHFTAGPYGGPGAIGNLNDAGDPVVGGNTVDPFWLDCAALKQMVLDLTSQADYYCNTDTMSCSPPAMSAGQIMVIDGDFSTNTDSAGILLVTGQLTYRGTTQWNGIVLVIGEGHIIRSGGGGGKPAGGLVVANIDPSVGGPYSNKSDWCTGAGSDGFGQAQYHTSGGGSSEVMYCSAYLNASNPVYTYQVVEFLQW